MKRGGVTLLFPLVPQARASLATAPQDGLKAEVLMASAEAAALKASAESLQDSGPNPHWLSLGKHSVLVADPKMVTLFERLRRLAAGFLNILIRGETGAGKENAAWAVHYWSRRESQPFVAINCAALPESLAESELFGYERGAFSGADRPRAGLLEQSSGGTLFLDEVGELPLSIQAKLLRAMEQRRITRLGDSREREVDLRIVSATNRVLEDEVKAGRFREDLYFRLRGAQVVLPPLRDRPQELPLLASAFLAEACARHNRPAPRFSAAAMEVLSAHCWRGNVRELKAAMDYVATLCDGPIVEPAHLPETLHTTPPPAPEPQATRASAPVEASTPAPSAPLEIRATEPLADPSSRTFRPLAEEVQALEKQRMQEALEATGGVQTRAARLLGVPLRTFALKLKRYKIS